MESQSVSPIVEIETCTFFNLTEPVIDGLAVYAELVGRPRDTSGLVQVDLGGLG